MPSIKFESIVIVLLLALGFECSANPIALQWAAVKTPVQFGVRAESIGNYNAGCLSGAVTLPVNGLGYQVMRLSRKRFYGHPDLTQFIENLGRKAFQQHLGVLLIGDLGQPRGGPTLTGHRSHQTGLDVDIWFLLSQQASFRKLGLNERETWSAPSVLLDDSDAINLSQWTLNNEKILELAARMPEVDRIFVNPSVKRHLCMSATAHDWLRKIRPWWKHDDHFHVRLKCPAQSKYCQAQEPLPQGDGCDASLAWWFSDEAKAPAAKKPEPAKPLALPELCQRILKN
ncbi:MAG: penicillin-insensitive murein endopeptidase [Methylococcaceae bacterium]|nr:penicillin-insensitive murein endopeptidase [Methylococcaceae bacterium]